MKSISIVTTLYRSSKYVDEFYVRIKKSLEIIGLPHELIFVNDGCPDNSLNKTITIAENDKTVKIVNLSKNHGHHRAMFIGLQYSKMEYVFLIDVDLEEIPENLLLFVNEYNKDPTIDCIYGVQHKKSGNLFKKILSLSFYKIFNLLTNLKLNNKELVSRLMSKKFVDAIIAHQESDLFLPAIWSSIGYKTKFIFLEKSFDNFSTYSLSKRFYLAINAITSYSSKPLIFVFYLGFFIFLLSLLLIFYFLYHKLIAGSPLIGWTTLVISIYLMGGLIIFSIGIVGIYISNIFNEVKKRPNSLISEVINGP